MFKLFSKNKSDKAYKKVKEDFNNLISIISAFNGKIHIPINKEDLIKFPIGAWVLVNELVRIRRRKQRFGDHLNFDTIMEKGGEFGSHFHEDMLESCEIEYGEMKDLEDNRIYKKGDVMEYDKGQHHTPIATKKTRLHVLFKP